MKNINFTTIMKNNNTIKTIILAIVFAFVSVFSYAYQRPNGFRFNIYSHTTETTAGIYLSEKHYGVDAYNRIYFKGQEVDNLLEQLYYLKSKSVEWDSICDSANLIIKANAEKKVKPTKQINVLGSTWYDYWVHWNLSYMTWYNDRKEYHVYDDEIGPYMSLIFFADDDRTSVIIFFNSNEELNAYINKIEELYNKSKETLKQRQNTDNLLK